MSSWLMLQISRGCCSGYRRIRSGAINSPRGKRHFRSLSRNDNGCDSCRATRKRSRRRKATEIPTAAFYFANEMRAKQTLAKRFRRFFVSPTSLSTYFFLKFPSQRFSKRSRFVSGRLFASRREKMTWKRVWDIAIKRTAKRIRGNHSRAN